MVFRLPYFRAVASIASEVRQSLRVLSRRPGFSAVVILTLAIGIGANAAIFSVIHSFLFRPLPYADPERVALILGWDERDREITFNTHERDLVDWGGQLESLESIGAYRYVRANLTGAGDPVMLRGYAVTPNLFDDILRVRPAHGRGFLPEEGRLGGNVAVLSHGAWQRLFDGENVIGRAVRINDEAHVIVGVMPRGFEFPQMNWTGEIWMPMRTGFAALGPSNDRGASIVTVGRLRGPAAAAEAELRVLSRRAAVERREREPTTIVVRPMQEMIRENARGATFLLAFAAGLVLLIACANVIHLLLAHHASRVREMSIRAALGASRRRLASILLIETVILFLMGGVASLIAGGWSLRALQGLVPESLRIVLPTALSFRLDLPTAAFSLGLALAAGALSGLVAAFRSTRRDLQSLLRDRSAGSGRAGERFRSGLVVAEVALSIVLLVVTSLIVLTVIELGRVDLGFRSENLLTMEVSLPEERYGSDRRRIDFFAEARERVEAMPGVESVSAAHPIPFSTMNRSVGLTIDGIERDPEDPVRTDFRMADAHYLETMGIPLLRGRSILPSDGPDSAPVALVNQRFVDRWLGTVDPLGRVARIGDEERTIVGVIGNVRHSEIAAQPSPELYVPLAQSASPTMHLVVRTSGDPSTVGPAIRREIAKIDPAQPVAMMQTMDEMIEFAMPQELAMKLVGSFAVLALTLAAIGLYGVLAHAVALRTKEIGVRMALGAGRGAVERQVIARGFRLVLLGVVLGSAGAFAAASLMRGLLYGVAPASPIAFAAAIAALMGAALIACWIPAHRATKVDPVVALRED